MILATTIVVLQAIKDDIGLLEICTSFDYG